MAAADRKFDTFSRRVNIETIFRPRRQWKKWDLGLDLGLIVNDAYLVLVVNDAYG